MPLFDEKIKSIEERLARIEERLNLSPPSTDKVFGEPSSKETTTPNIQVERNSKSGNWLGIIAILCFVLAAGFIIKLSIDSGWLTPIRQIGIAVLFGITLIGAGIKLLNYDKSYASLLPAAGIIILYLATFAAHRLYFLIPFETAVVLCSFVSLLSIGLYLKIRQDIYPLVASVGAYLAPLVLGLNAEATFTLGYFLLCSLTFAILSIYSRSRILTIISAYLAILTTAEIGLDLHQDSMIAWMLGLHFFIFSIGTYFYTSYRGEPLTERESWSFFPVLLIFYVAEYHFVALIQPTFAAWLSLAFAGFLMFLYLIAKKVFVGRDIPSKTMIFTFTALICFHAGYLELLPSIADPWLFVGLLFGFALLPAKMLNIASNKTENTWRSFSPFLFAIMLIACIEYGKMVLDLFSFTDQQPSLLSPCLATIGIWLLFIRHNDDFKREQIFGYAILVAAHLIAVLALYRLVTDSGSLAVSATWLIYATGVIIFAFLRKDKVIANSALLVFGFAAVKVLIYDVASASASIRILCLLLTGTVLYAAGFLYRKIAAWKR